MANVVSYVDASAHWINSINKCTLGRMPTDSVVCLCHSTNESTWETKKWKSKESNQTNCCIFLLVLYRRKCDISSIRICSPLLLHRLRFTFCLFRKPKIVCRRLLRCMPKRKYQLMVFNFSLESRGLGQMCAQNDAIERKSKNCRIFRSRTI